MKEVKKHERRGGWVGGKAILRLQTSQEERKRKRIVNPMNV